MANQAKAIAKRRAKKSKVSKKPQKMTEADMAWHLAKKAWEGLKYVKTLINSELLKLDKTHNVFTTTITGYADSFVSIAQSDTEAGRTGNSVLIKAVRLQAMVRINTSTPNPCTYVRIIILRDTQEITDLLYPAIDDVLESVADSSIIRSPLNAQTVGRYTILADTSFPIDTYHPQKSYSVYCPVMKHTRYNGASTTDIQRGNIFFYVLTDGVTVGLNNPTCDVNTRTYYHDN